MRDEPRTAEGPSKIVLAEGCARSDRRLLLVSPVVRIQDIVSEKLIDSAVELRGARAGDDIDHAARAAPVLGAVVAAQNLELLDGIDAGIIQQREVASAVDVIRAVHGPVI